MNKDVFEGKWKEMRGQVKEWWGKLTDDDLEQAGGKADQLNRLAPTEVRLHPRARRRGIQPTFR